MLKSLTLLGQSDQEIKFKAPALHFTQSAPLGNRRMGVLWSLENPNRTDAASHLKALQQLLQEGENKEAQACLQKYFNSAGKGSGHGKGVVSFMTGKGERFLIQ